MHVLITHIKDYFVQEEKRTRNFWQREKEEEQEKEKEKERYT